MKIWLDDTQEPPDDSWTWCKSGMDATLCYLVDQQDVIISFNQTLGEKDSAIYGLAVLIESHGSMGKFPVKEWFIHSSHPFGRSRIKDTMESYERFRK